MNPIHFPTSMDVACGSLGRKRRRKPRPRRVELERPVRTDRSHLGAAQSFPTLTNLLSGLGRPHSGQVQHQERFLTSGQDADSGSKAESRRVDSIRGGWRRAFFGFVARAKDERKSQKKNAKEQRLASPPSQHEDEGSVSPATMGAVGGRTREK